MREVSPETWVLWIHASNAARYEQGVRDIAELANIPGRSDPKADINTLFRNWLRQPSTGSWLIVLNNADNVDFLLERKDGQASLYGCLPVCDNGTILITSRSMPAAIKLVERKEIVSIPPIDELQAIALLEKKLEPHEDNRALAVALEYMPLAITQAAAYIQQRGKRWPIQKYLNKLQRSNDSKITILDENAGDLRRDPEAHNAIVLTWRISFEHIRRVRRSAADLLSLMCFCDRHAIPSILLRPQSSDIRKDTGPLDLTRDPADLSDTGSEHSSAAEDDFDDDIMMLEGYAFVSSTKDSSTFEMHRLIQLATQL